MEGQTEQTDWEERPALTRNLTCLTWVNPQSPVGEWRVRTWKPTEITLLVHGGDRNLILDFLTLRPRALSYISPSPGGRAQKALAVVQVRNGKDLARAEVREKPGENELERR